MLIEYRCERIPSVKMTVSERAPSGFGELAVQHVIERGAWSHWAFRNVPVAAFPS